MKRAIVSLFHWIWNVYCLAIVLMICIIFLPILFVCVLLPLKNHRPLCNSIASFAGEILLLLCGIRIRRSKEMQLLKPKEHTVFICNHTSYLDVLICVILLPKDLVYLSKAEVFNWPILGFFMRRLGHLSVQRKSRTDRAKSLELLKHQTGKSHIILYPEGGIHSNKNILHPYKQGAFVAAEYNSSPLQHLLLANISQRMPLQQGKPFLVPGVITATMSSDLNPTRYSTAEEMKKTAFEWASLAQEHWRNEGIIDRSDHIKPLVSNT